MNCVQVTALSGLTKFLLFRIQPGNSGSSVSGNWLETQTLGPHPTPAGSNLHLDKDSERFMGILTFEKH